MDNLYKTIETLCRERGVTITEMCRGADVSRSNLTELKKGRQKTLGPVTLEKIAAYFGTTVGALIGSQTEKTPASEKAEVDEKDVRYALFAGEVVSDETWDKVLSFVHFALEEERRKKQKGEQ